MSATWEPSAFTEHLRRLTAIIDSASDAYFLVDCETQKFVYTNRTATERLGYTAEEFLNLSVPDINPAMSAARLCAIIEQIQHSPLFPYEAEHRRKDGSCLPVEMSLSAMQVDGRALILGVARDLTQRKRTEAALAEENRINDALNRVGSIVAAELDRERAAQAVTDAATELTTAQFGAFFYNVTNRAGESYQLFALSGVPRASFAKFPMPRNTAIFAPTFSGDHVVRLADVTADTRYGKSAPHYGMPPGHLPVRSYLAVPVRGRTGVIGGLFFGHAEANVFTERHERIAVGLASWAAVAIDNARLYAQVKDALEEARRANLLKDEFLAVLSHELRTPLNAILGWTHLLQTSRVEPPTLAKALDTIERNAQLQLQLIEDLLDVSAALTGNLHLRLRPVAVEKIVKDAVASVEPTARAKQITIDERMLVPHVQIFGDARRVQQMVWNLLTNAIKFTPSGGRVTISVETVAHDVAIRVADTGEGIDPAFLPRVFDRFRQGDASATRRHGGLGLGLALVQSFAEAHGGRVDAHSDGKGCGATFTIYLPLESPVDDADVAAGTQPGPAAASVEGVSVLLVDDDGDARDIMMSVLQRSGAIVRAVSSAQAALDVLLTWRPRIIITDLAMPELDGIAFIRLLRARPREHGGDLRVIGMTAYAGLERRDEARVAGFERLLIKPVRHETLVQSISAALATERSLS